MLFEAPTQSPLKPLKVTLRNLMPLVAFFLSPSTYACCPPQGASSSTALWQKKKEKKKNTQIATQQKSRHNATSRRTKKSIKTKRATQIPHDKHNNTTRNIKQCKSQYTKQKIKEKSGTTNEQQHKKKYRNKKTQQQRQQKTLKLRKEIN